MKKIISIGVGYYDNDGCYHTLNLNNRSEMGDCLHFGGEYCIKNYVAEDSASSGNFSFSIEDENGIISVVDY